MAGGRRSPQRIGGRAARQGPFAVDRCAKGVDNGSKPAFGRAYCGPFGLNADFGTGGDPFDRAEWHQQGTCVARADHLGGQGRCAGAFDLRLGPDRQSDQTAAGLDQQAVHRRHTTRKGQDVDMFNGRNQALHEMRNSCGIRRSASRNMVSKA